MNAPRLDTAAAEDYLDWFRHQANPRSLRSANGNSDQLATFLEEALAEVAVLRDTLRIAAAGERFTTTATSETILYPRGALAKFRAALVSAGAPQDREGRKLPSESNAVSAAAVDEACAVAPPGAEPEDRRKELSGRLRTGNPASPVAVPQPPARQEVLPLVVADLTARIEKGTAEYGGPLTTRNGRAALRDAYEEALDLALYLRQALDEGAGGVLRGDTLDD